jgi:hypothetical protein
VRPERRRRGDVVAAAAIVLVLVAGAGALWRTSPAAGTASVTADPPITAPPPAVAVPPGFTEAWREPSAATPVPVVSGPAVVTAEGSAVVGRDPATGEQRWSYTRDLPLCTVGAGFPTADNGLGRVIAVFGDGDFCSELTALRPDSGARAEQRNPDVRPGTRVLKGGGFVAVTGADYLEVMRSDLVKTLEFGTVPVPEQVDRQPRSGCTFGSFAMAPGRVGVLERCPGETTDRLTVLVPDGADGAATPEEEFSVLLPSGGATLVALSADVAAVALPDPPSLQLLDPAGSQVALIALDVPAADLAADPPGGVAATMTDGERVLWWTGSRTVALGATDLEPLWTLPGTTGPGVTYAGRLLLPVASGLTEVDAERGVRLADLPLDRGGWSGPVRQATQGEVLVEQRGDELVALLPTR